MLPRCCSLTKEWNSITGSDYSPKQLFPPSPWGHPDVWLTISDVSWREISPPSSNSLPPPQCTLCSQQQQPPLTRLSGCIPITRSFPSVLLGSCSLISCWSSSTLLSAGVSTSGPILPQSHRCDAPSDGNQWKITERNRECRCKRRDSFKTYSCRI